MRLTINLVAAILIWKIKTSKNSQKCLEFRKTLEMCFPVAKKTRWKIFIKKNIGKYQTLELHNRVKNAAQNLSDFNLHLFL